MDRLVEATDAGGLEASFLKLLDGVGLGFADAGAAGVAAFERVIGEKFDVGPPGSAVEMGWRRSLLGGRGGGEEKNDGSGEKFAHACAPEVI